MSASPVRFETIRTGSRETDPVFRVRKPLGARITRFFAAMPLPCSVA